MHSHNVNSTHNIGGGLLFTISLQQNKKGKTFKFLLSLNSRRATRSRNSRFASMIKRGNCSTYSILVAGSKWDRDVFPSPGARSFQWLPVCFFMSATRWRTPSSALKLQIVKFRRYSTAEKKVFLDPVSFSKKLGILLDFRSSSVLSLQSSVKNWFGGTAVTKKYTPHTTRKVAIHTMFQRRDGKESFLFAAAWDRFRNMMV